MQLLILASVSRLSPNSFTINWEARKIKTRKEGELHFSCLPIKIFIVKEELETKASLYLYYNRNYDT